MASLRSGINYVPKHNTVQIQDLEPLYGLIKTCKKLFVITGAGVSTESGLPDYRSKETGLIDRKPNFKPTNYQDFMKNEITRRVYWARSFVGWNYQMQRTPNITHYTLANWEDRQKIHCLVTQNVDRLHHKAGSKKVIELHGTLYEVRCMSCETIVDRFTFQKMLGECNQNAYSMNLETRALRPDGDVELDSKVASQFQIPSCTNCRSKVMKPNVVFYGENVPTMRKQAVKASIETSNGILVLGTTLHTRSGRDHVEYAAKLGIPIGIINIGPSYCDELAMFKIDARCGEVMKILCENFNIF